ncbi:MFS transporter [Candidatus Hydrogenisulfobacillus filiaventi]|uniref:MFS transporter n=1 Tax=Candidatus Hydrogenisulfobacillus filiaventi TaxID=2707344 RepID=A0A6F8ZGC4_9FIRM|nr:MFS transporter [Bacillota bacterium]CAB1128830.1 MFS transporter [Candidatus Hydrogenisulfobacillus filiaventi]
MKPAPAPAARPRWSRLHPVTRQLIATRFLRSVAQGALSVDFTLYLRARQWSAGQVGLLLMAAGLTAGALGLGVGIASDRHGRKRFLLVYEAGLALATLAVLLFPHAWVLILTATLFGFGRGANGSSGPFNPAEQAWLAQNIPAPERGPVFSLNAMLQFWGMGIGGLLAAVLPHLLPGVRGPAAYRPVFALTLLVALINLVQIAWIPETPPPPPEKLPDPRAEAEDRRVRRQENRALVLLVGVNMVNGLGVGLIAPLLPYWFNLRFGAGPASIGPVYGLAFFVTGFSSLLVGRLSQLVGLTKAIVWPRLIGVALLLAIPFAPAFSWAAALYILRSVVNRGSLGARQAFSVGLVRDRRRGFASSLNALSWSLPAALGPALGGWLLDLGSLTVPFLLAAGLQLAYVGLFSRVMGPYAPEAGNGAVDG